MTWTVASFYKFVGIADGAALRARLLDGCRAQGIVGTILIAPEGINATIAGSEAGIEATLDLICGDSRFADVAVKRSHADGQPFRRLKVKLKREIVTFGVAQADPGRRVGAYVAPADWNALIDDPDVVLIDARNTYEVAVGTFPGALDPGTTAFSELPGFVASALDPARHRKVAMFCTGGIRCEKASAYMLAQGFAEVYHLRGGILGYLEAVPPEQSLWQGECYVFDERVALQHGLAEGTHAMRPECGHPVPRDSDALEACALCGEGARS